jgi:hypothetical protein
MKTYRLIIQTSFYKTIEVKAENEDDVPDAASEWMDMNDALYGAEIDTEFHDIEEVKS